MDAIRIPEVNPLALGGQPVLGDCTGPADLDVQEPRERLGLPVGIAWGACVVHDPGDHPVLVGTAMTPHVFIQAQGFHVGLLIEPLPGAPSGASRWRPTRCSTPPAGHGPRQRR